MLASDIGAPTAANPLNEGRTGTFIATLLSPPPPHEINMGNDASTKGIWQRSLFKFFILLSHQANLQQN